MLYKTCVTFLTCGIQKKDFKWKLQKSKKKFRKKESHFIPNGLTPFNKLCVWNSPKMLTERFVRVYTALFDPIFLELDIVN